MAGRGAGDRVSTAALAALPGFATLADETQSKLAASFDLRNSRQGEVLIRQGEPPPGLLLLLAGRAEVSQLSPAGRSVLTEVGPGTILGEMSFVGDGDAAEATVTALADVQFAVLPRADFTTALVEHPELAEAIAANSLYRHRANLLAHIFGGLDAPGRRALANSIRAIDVDAGTVLVRQGEPGRNCYVIASGSAEVMLDDTAGERRVLAALPAGTLVGEAALLTDQPRDASVVMKTDGTVLALSRSDLLHAAGNDGAASPELVALLRMRWRPVQRPGVEVSAQTTPEGDTIVILKDPARDAYFRMAADGAFIWSKLDGATTLRDIAMAYAAEFGAFAPERVAQAVKDLVDEGFADTAKVAASLKSDDAPRGAGAIAVRALGALAWTRGVSGVDRLFARLHRALGSLFTRLGVAVLGVIGVAGIILTIVAAPRSSQFIEDAGGAIVLLGLIPANAIGAVCHEAAHGIAVKHFGRRVNRAGVGWYLITPVAFVDTSDMWLEDRRKRALVSVAGPFANLVVAGLAAIAATLASSPVAVAILWQFVLASFYLAVINLNPLLEFDGYYILSDFLDRPNLRDEALRWIGTELPSAVRTRSGFVGHGVDLMYGLLAVLYIALVGFFMLVVYRLVLEGLVSNVVSDGLASGLAWAFAAAVATIAALATWAQMRGLQTPRH